MPKKGETYAGRRRFNPEERRLPVCISMGPTMHAAIDNAIAAGGFSLKVEIALNEWMIYKQQLVQYHTAEQKAAGTPVLLNAFAERVYACSDFQTGYSYHGGRYAEVVQELIDNIETHKTSTKTQVWVNDVLAPVLRSRGFIVQVVDEVESDLYDVWMCDSLMGEAGKHCGSCSVVNEIGEYIDALRKRK